MSELATIVRREWRERVLSRAFLLSTLLTPLFFVLVLLVPVAATRWERAREATLVVVAEAPQAVVDAAVAQLPRQRPAQGRGVWFRIEVVRQPLGAVRAALEQRVRREEIDGFLWLSPTVVQGGPAVLWTRNPAGEMAERVRNAVTEAVREHRLRAAGVDPAAMARLLAPVPFDAVQVTSRGTRAAGPALALAFVLTFLLYFLTFTYGIQAMQSAQEERTNRIAEILATSVPPSRLLLGKVLGVAGAALVQVSAWVLLVVGALAVIGTAREALPLPPGFLASLRSAVLQPAALWFLAFALLGFLLYSTLFAAVGATTDTPEEAQRFVWVLFLPLFLPMILQAALLRDPTGPVAQVLTWLPLTTPLVVPMRLALDAIAPLEVGLAFVTTALAVGLLGWLAGKVYRIGILSTGQSLTWRNLVRWLRAA